MVGKVEIALYCQDGKSACQFIEEQWKRLNGSLLLRIQLFFIESLHLRARSSLALAAQSNNPEPSLRAAERDAATIEKEKMVWGNSLALLIRAAVEVMRGNREQAITMLAKAEDGFKATDMALYAAAARYRRGKLKGGSEG